MTAAYDAVAYSNYYGLFNGYGGGIYAPEDGMTRAMFVTVLWNMEASPVPSGAGSFADVMPGAWEHDAAQWAYESGIISGAGGSFAPGRAVTRQEMAVMLYNYASYKGYAIPETRPLPGFKDFAQIDPWAEMAARKLSEAGVFSGDEFMPQKTATRADAAQLFKNFLRFVAAGGAEENQPSAANTRPPEAYVGESAAEAIKRALASGGGEPDALF